MKKTLPFETRILTQRKLDSKSEGKGSPRSSGHSPMSSCNEVVAASSSRFQRSILWSSRWEKHEPTDLDGTHRSLTSVFTVMVMSDTQVWPKALTHWDNPMEDEACSRRMDARELPDVRSGFQERRKSGFHSCLHTSACPSTSAEPMKTSRGPQRFIAPSISGLYRP